jgi:outer membrane immunogenic protein
LPGFFFCCAAGGCTTGTGCFGGGAVPPLALGTSFANGINAAGLNLNNGNHNRGGFLGGGQIGINWQFTPAFVVGAELDFQGVWTNRNDNGLWNCRRWRGWLPRLHDDSDCRPEP